MRNAGTAQLKLAADPPAVRTEAPRTDIGRRILALANAAAAMHMAQAAHGRAPGRITSPAAGDAATTLAGRAPWKEGAA